MDIRVILLCIVAANFAASKKKRPPHDMTTCNECISAHPKYAWCLQRFNMSEMRFRGSNSRCNLKSQLTNSLGCPDKNVDYPQPAHIAIAKKKALRPNRPISPQKLTLSLRRVLLRLRIIQRMYFCVTCRVQPESYRHCSAYLFDVNESVEVKFRYPRAVRIDVKSSCKGFEWKNKIVSCNGISRGKVQFRLKVKMKRCLPKPKKIKAIVDGNKKKSLKIVLKSRCSCDCEKNAIPHAPTCNTHGTLSCGVCECDKGYHGNTCECDDAVLSPQESKERCTSSNSSLCSSRGVCVCGVCHCDSRMSNGFKFGGQYCEEQVCDNERCPRHNGEKCGGPERGICECGCTCNAGYTGTACEVSLATDNCVSPVSGFLCNNHGVCFDNKCRCEGLYVGKTCDECPTCPGMCLLLKPCVECFAFHSGPLTEEECRTNCTDVTRILKMVASLDEEDRETPRLNRLHRCMFKDKDDCMYRFGYNYQNPKHKRVRVETVKGCPIVPA